jgi:hypothetical protein
VEQRVSGKYRPACIILQVPADTVLSVARCIQRLHSYISQFEHLAIPRGLGDAVAVLPADYRFEIKCGSLLMKELAV